MTQRGLLPDFSPAVLAETEAIGKAATDTGPSIRDLRDLLWCSIDNDDSRDLDQLSVTGSRPVAEVLAGLETTPAGLTAAEATSRLKRYAPRRLAPKKRTDAATLLLAQFSSPIVLLLLGATAISLFLHDTTDAAIILAIVVASGLLGFWQERGAAGAVEKLLSLVEVTLSPTPQTWKDCPAQAFRYSDGVERTAISRPQRGQWRLWRSWPRSSTQIRGAIAPAS